jgi:hypothetical protein
MRSVLLAATLMCMLWGGGEPAAAQQTDWRANVSDFAVSNLTRAAQLAGYQSEVISMSDGSQAVGVIAANGIRFIAQPVVCNTDPDFPGCIGLAIWSNFNGWSPTLDDLNNFNVQRIFTKAYFNGAQVVLARYEIADFGIPIGNIVSNMTNYAARGAEFKAFLNSNAQTVALAPESPAQGHAAGSAAAPAEIAEALAKAGDQPEFANSKDEKIAR